MLGLLAACAFAGPGPGAERAFIQLTTNGRADPLGIGAEALSFGWATSAATRGAAQTAYRIQILGTDSAVLWDSGRVDSDRQVDISAPASLTFAAGTRYAWRVKTWNERGAEGEWSAPARFETGLPTAADWDDARWISAPAAKPGAPLPLLRNTFTVAKEIRSARLYATARGIYQLSLNGQKIGDQFLAPGWTDYAQRLQSQTYDVTALLRPGANALGAALGDGWYRGQVGLGWREVYGAELSLLARLRIDYADGSVAWFDTGPRWTCAEGPWRSADLQNGEIYDARHELAGWDTPGFDASASVWTPVRVVDTPAARIVPQPDEPVRATEVLVARARTEPAPGEYVYDLGQNLVGVARVRITGKAGQTIRLRHAEELYRKGDRAGRLYTDNLRKARATDTYTFARDGVATYQPTFTQHGFRYVEITGTDTPPEPADVQGVVLGSDLPNIGDLRTGHAMLDQLVRNIRWGQRGNFLSIPTDTPARDERLGWTGDIAVFAPTASYYQDTRAFLSKWMTDVRDTQRDNGNIPAVVPQPRREFDETGVGWSDAFIAVPHAVWRATGDARIVRENWDAMRRFFRFVHESATRDGDLLEQGRSSWFSGDWLNLEKVNRLEEHQVIATAYFAENTRMMAEMAAVVGDTETAAACVALLPKIRAAFVAAYRQPDGRIHLETQTVYAMALGMGLIEDATARRLTGERFVEKLAADDFHLRTGFLGTPWLLPALTAIGRDDLAMRLLLNDTYPSWGFEIRMGATTMWERWNTIRADGEFGPVDMNSFNHYAYGAVAEWMFRHLPLEPGFKKSRIAPLFGHDRVRNGAGTLRTPYGLLSCDWRKTDEKLTVAVEVPVNTTAEVVIPAASTDAVLEGDTPARSAAGVLASELRDGALVLTVGSGRYVFTAPVSADP